MHFCFISKLYLSDISKALLYSPGYILKHRTKPKEKQQAIFFCCCKLQSELWTCLPGDLFFLTCPAHTEYLLYWLGPHIRSKGVLGSASKNAYVFCIETLLSLFI